MREDRYFLFVGKELGCFGWERPVVGAWPPGLITLPTTAPSFLRNISVFIVARLSPAGYDIKSNYQSDH